MTLILRLVMLGLGIWLVAGAGRATEDYIWWEAENPKSTNFPATHPFTPYNAQEASVLSEGKWIGASDLGKVGFLEYDVTVPAPTPPPTPSPLAGMGKEEGAERAYNFYVRKFWKHGPFKWRFDDQPWRECGKEIALLDEVGLRQFVVANWVSLGAVKLKTGTHLLRIELLETKGAAAFDCFLLIPGPFTPRGKLKPGQKYNRAPDGWFPFEPDADSFAPTPLDLRSLNEKFAGENGFIQVKGETFVHEKNGQPVRFWAINTGMDTVRLDRTSLDYFARRLAKLGVNMVRLHGSHWKSGDLSQLDAEMLDKTFYFISALKKEGIYTCLSIYFPVWLHLNAGDGYEGYNGQSPFSLLFFNKKLQGLYKNWWRALLTTKNPYSGVPLNQDPALAFTEIINEDSYFFWTFTPYQNIPAPQMALLEKQFGDWLKTKYGGVEQALAKWGGGKVRGDEAGAGRAGFMAMWEIFNKKDQRAQDTAEFLTVSQKAFFEEMTAYLKKDLQFKGSVYGSNWITADARILGPLDKYSNTVCDFMDRHGYYGGPHEGERAGYSISKGDKYDDACALLFESGNKHKGEKQSFGLPVMDVAYNGKPSIITEINWPPPNRYRADLPLLAAAYGALQGSDGFFFFATGEPGWSQSLAKFAISNPAIMGQFPATALLYRRGLVKESAPAVHSELKLADLYALKGAPVSAPQNLDEFRKKDIPAGKAIETDALAALDPLAFLVGRVEMNITEKGGQSKLLDLSKYIDRNASTVRSATGELFWDYGRGLVTVNAPAAQGAMGFLSKAGAVELSGVTVNSGMDYGVVLLVALDEQPLQTSKKMLLQVMSEDADFGWSAPGSGFRAIADVGEPPLVVKKFTGTVSLKRPDADVLRVTALDFNGYPDKPAGTGKSVSLLASTMYYLIEK